MSKQTQKRSKSASRPQTSQRDSIGFEKEYKEVRGLNMAHLKLLTEKQSELEEELKVLARKTLVEIQETRASRDSMKSRLTKTRNTLMATGKYMAVDLKPAFSNLSETIRRFASTMRRKVEEETKVHGKISAEEYIAMASGMEELLDYAEQLNISIGEMEAEMRIAFLEILSAEHDFDEVHKIVIEREQKKREEKRREEEEKRRKKEEEKLRKEELLRKKKEEEERRKREEEEMEMRRKEEEENRRQEEERRRLEEEEMERKREEEEERMRMEEEERRRREEELEKQRIQEEERQKRAEKEARMEEERLKKQEEERWKKEEAARRRQEEEERKRKLDPNNWENVLIFDADTDFDGIGHRLACVIRVADDVTITKNHVTCTVLDMSINRYNLQEDEEVVGNMIHLKPKDNTDLSFESRVWVAFPYHLPAAKNREVFIKIQKVSDNESHGLWTEAPTREAKIQGKIKEIIKLVETSLDTLHPEGLNAVVVSKPKADRRIFDGKGGQLISNQDPRISVTIPKHAFTTPSELTIQTLPLDYLVVKERHGGCENLLGTSPIVVLRCQQKPQKPIGLSMASPSGAGKRSRPRTGTVDRIAPGDKTGVRPRTSLGYRYDEDKYEEDIAQEFVNLLTRDSSGRWRSRDEVSLTSLKDSIVFEMLNPAERFLLLRTSKVLSNQDLSKIASNLDESLKERLISIIVKQKSSDVNRLHVECCRSDSISKRIQSLLDDQFTLGPDPRSAVVKEGDLIEISFDGNIEFADSSSRFVGYHSYLTSAKVTVEIKVVDVFAQNGFENFRGSLRLRLVDRKHNSPLKFMSKENISANNPNIADPDLISQFQITLPKPPKEMHRAKKIRLPISREGPLDDEYFDSLSIELALEWHLLAQKLKFGSAAIQRIKTDHAHLLDDANQKSAKQMLFEWFRRSTIASNKVDELRLALEAVNRRDLAEELNNMNKEFREETELKQKDAKLKRCIKAYCDSQAAVNRWSSVGLQLGLEEEDITDISSRLGSAGPREQAREMMLRWMEVLGDRATQERLIRCLKKLKLNEAVGKVKLVS